AAKPEYDTRTASLQLESILVKAQNMAVNQQKHTRVVVNCARVAGNKNCFADIESAVYDEYSVAGWEKRLEDREVLKPEIRVVKARPSATHSAKEEDMSETDVFWAIFMPSRHVFSEPQGFRLFIYHNSQPEPRKDGWRLTVNSLSGQVQLSRDSLTPKV
ncbi:MAG: hypothetical protein LBT38_02365, partial [Deltaproteobacteria bacterium]|nr:hypothetical protein [Deltaproteobacteria bacterium]